MGKMNIFGTSNENVYLTDERAIVRIKETLSLDINEANEAIFQKIEKMEEAKMEVMKENEYLRSKWKSERQKVKLMRDKFTSVYLLIKKDVRSF